MKLLLDTHLLLWFTAGSKRISHETRALIEDPSSEPMFSAASIWEVAIKNALRRPRFEADARVVRRALLEDGFLELQVTSAHAAEVQDLPRLHGDPFDRLLVAQARCEGIRLLTADRQLLAYDSLVRLA